MSAPIILTINKTFHSGKLQSSASSIFSKFDEFINCYSHHLLPKLVYCGFRYVVRNQIKAGRLAKSESEGFKIEECEF